MEYNLPIDSSVSPSNFLKYFVKKSGFLTIRALAEKGELGRLGIRTNSWRLFLGIFAESSTHEQWLQVLETSRSTYSCLKASFHISDPLLGVRST